MLEYSLYVCVITAFKFWTKATAFTYYNFFSNGAVSTKLDGIMLHIIVYITTLVVMNFLGVSNF